MSFIKSNKLVSYERIGKFIKESPKESWINLKESLAKEGYNNHLEPLMPAFKFFESVGHLDIKNSSTEAQIEILVHSKRQNRDISKGEIIRQIR